MDCKGVRGSGCWNENGVGFRERRSSFSLEIRAIRPLAVFGPRRKTFCAEQATRGLRIRKFLQTP